MSQKPEMPSNLSRRHLLTTTCALVGASLVGQLLAACAPAAAPPGVSTSAPTSTATVASQPTSAPTSAAAPALTPTTAAATVAATPTTAPTQAAAGISPTPTAAPFREAAAGRQKTIEVWCELGGDYFTATAKWVEMFEQKEPTIGVRLSYGGGYGKIQAKLLTAVAGGKPPDVSWADSSQLCSFAAAGAFQSLSDRMKTAKFASEEYWQPSWNTIQWKGQFWAVPLSSDPNYGFLWNKQIFQDAGLDPEKGPTTIAEVDAFDAKIFKKDGNNIGRMGIIPWASYGNDDSMFTWGWLFGGEYYDPTTQKVTADNDLVVKALDWEVTNYAKKYGAEAIAGFLSGAKATGNHPFFGGKAGMGQLGPWELPNIKRYAPNMQFGITYMPTGPAPALPHSAWVGGWTAGIPQGAKDPDSAFSLLSYFTHSDEGTNFHGTGHHQFPSYKKSPYYADVVDKDPQLKPFHGILQEARHAYPVMPALAFYANALVNAVDSALLGKQSPKEALTQVKDDTQKELDRILKQG